MPGRKKEQGIIIVLVAVFMLFVVGAMAALAIDVVTLYTARSEAQLAADAGALAGARVLANSGMTSNSLWLANAEIYARQVAQLVATHNWVGGNANTNRLVNAQVTSTINDNTPSDPRITVLVQVTDLPTFFARIWGRQQLAVSASATAEAYNPSPPVGGAAIGNPPVAPICVKPWLLPNIDPTGSGPTTNTPIFDPPGTIHNPNLVGVPWPNSPSQTEGLYAACGDCSAGGSGIPSPKPGAYYPGAIDATDFPAPTQALPACSAGFNAYQVAIAGCVQQPISCGVNPNINVNNVNIDTSPYVSNSGLGRDYDTVQAVGCLIHYGVPGGVLGDADSIDAMATPTPPFVYRAGNQNPIQGVRDQDVWVSDSLVTIPVIDATTTAPANPVTVIGFLQVFLNPLQSFPAFSFPMVTGSQSSYEIPAMIINMAGCGTSVSGSPILGNGASPVAVRLVSP